MPITNPELLFAVHRSHIPFGVSLLDSIAGPMVTINSSFNFIIYCILGEAFRKESVKFLDELKKKHYKFSLKWVPHGVEGERWLCNPRDCSSIPGTGNLEKLFIWMKIHGLTQTS